MEITASPSPSSEKVVTRKLWKIVRMGLLMVRKGMAKSKVAVDLSLLLKRGKVAATKAIANTILHRPQNDGVYQQRDYEFSCSNTPFHVIKRRKHRCSPHYDDVRRVLEILNNRMEASPPLPTGGRKLIRVTDSPFPLKEKDQDEGEDHHVDVAAEEFIKRFYKDLNLQHQMAAIESPYLWDR